MNTAVSETISVNTKNSKNSGSTSSFSSSIIKAMFRGAPAPFNKIESPGHFFEQLCDKSFLHITTSGNATSSPGRSKDFFRTQLPIEWSTDIMRATIRDKRLRHKTDINIVRYDQAEKRRIDFLETEEMQCTIAEMEELGEDDGYPLVTVEDFDRAISSGWSVRFLRPQEHVASISAFLFNLEEELQCSCGVNSYWTPHGSQGFSPHWDDVDVFLLQLEGQKHWRLYKPPAADVHPRVSSEDLQQDEIGEPIFDGVLKQGEMIYMPRGTIHQGDTTHVGKLAPNGPQHSLHVTFSAFQMHTWADIVESTYKYRCELSAANTVGLRQTLPLNWQRVMGSICNSKMMGPHVAPLSASEQLARSAIQKKMREFFTEIHTSLMQKDGVLDKGVDVHARSVLERRQPPPPAPCSSVGNSNGDDDGKNAGSSTTRIPIAQATKIRLCHKSSVRFVMMTDEVRLYHCGGNSVVCMAPKLNRCPPQRLTGNESDGNNSGEDDEEDDLAVPSSASGMLRFEMAYGPALATIVAKSPNWVPLNQLPGMSFGHNSGAEDDEDDAAAIGAEEARAMINALLGTLCFELSCE